MKVNKAYKVRLYLNLKQKDQIELTISHSRFIFNQMLAERIEKYDALGKDKFLLYRDKYKTEKQYKILFPFLKKSSSWALQSSRRD